MTLDEIFEAVRNAPPSDKLKVAEESLRKYDGDDLEYVAPWVMEMAAVEQEI